MTKELWWAIGAVVGLFLFTRWGLPALGWRRDCCGGNCQSQDAELDNSNRETDEDRWSKTERFTETTVQLPPKER